MSLENEIHQLLKRHADIGNRKARVEGALLSCEQEEKDIRAECLRLGVEPDELPSEISRLEDQIQAEMKQLDQNLQQIDGLLRQINY